MSKYRKTVPDLFTNDYKFLDRDFIVNEILGILKDMSDNQLKNVYDYVCDEYDEEDHESHSLEIIQQLARDNERLKMYIKERE